MSARRKWATAARVLRQIRHDHRTVAMLVVVPVLIMTIMHWILPAHDFATFGPPLLGIFPLLIMFLITSVTTLRERSGGTLERLLSMPVAKADIVGGYALAFGVLGALQAVVVAGFSFWVLGLAAAGPGWQLGLLAVVQALLGTALGLFVSAFAATEFQAVQFMPAVLIPQLLLCGLIVPVAALPTVARWIADVLPLTYAMNAVREVMRFDHPTAAFWSNLAIVGLFVVALLVAGAATLRRRTA